MRLSITSILFNVVYKLYYLVVRLLDIFRFFPLRLGRFINHLGKGIQQLSEIANLSGTQVLFWWVELILFILDLFGLMELYESLMDLLKFNTRPLHDWEIELARSVYGDSIRYHRVRIDQLAFLGPRKYHLVYVSGFTINSWGYMNNSLLIHELMHIWQYQRLGLVYIPKALRAFHSVENYNYGGISRLRRVKAAQGNIWSFNLEQQADVMADYYRIKQRTQPAWGNAGMVDLPVYEYFVDEVRYT